MEKIKKLEVTQSVTEDIKAIEEVAAEILLGGAYKATRYLSKNRTVKATRKLYKGGWKRGDKVDLVVTIGKPNYEEREAIEREKKAGRPPIEMTIKMPPRMKKAVGK